MTRAYLSLKFVLLTFKICLKLFDIVRKHSVFDASLSGFVWIHTFLEIAYAVCGNLHIVFSLLSWIFRIVLVLIIFYIFFKYSKYAQKCKTSWKTSSNITLIVLLWVCLITIATCPCKKPIGTWLVSPFGCYSRIDLCKLFEAT